MEDVWIGVNMQGNKIWTYKANMDLCVKVSVNKTMAGTSKNIRFWYIKLFYNNYKNVLHTYLQMMQKF